jgi:D-cysteine desulfhydrase family pyridoxal phosphate-dependent enzyme
VNVSIDLDRLPRFPLANLPTPLQEATRLREALGGPGACPRILIKRDDLTGLAFGGNKVRKLEFLIGDALAKNATIIITAGAAQSNHARATAAAAVVAGLPSVLVLNTDEAEPADQGNLLIDRLLGAEIRFVPKGSDSDAEMAKVADELSANGEVPYVIPVGGSNEIGAAGYLTMSLELQGQMRAMDARPTRLYFGNGSRGTQAGIVLGAIALGMPYRSYGVLDSPNSPLKEERAVRIANRAAELVGSDTRVSDADMINVDGYFGEAYGVPTTAGDEAIVLLARTEAILLDPVYSGKAMSGLIDHIRTGQIPADETVVFVHTGGNSALFAHADRLARLARAG